MVTVTLLPDAAAVTPVPTKLNLDTALVSATPSSCTAILAPEPPGIVMVTSPAVALAVTPVPTKLSFEAVEVNVVPSSATATAVLGIVTVTAPAKEAVAVTPVPAKLNSVAPGVINAPSSLTLIGALELLIHFNLPSPPTSQDNICPVVPPGIYTLPAVENLAKPYTRRLPPSNWLLA